MNINSLDTPALLIEREIVIKNLNRMQVYANKSNVALRPHTKTHKMSKIALKQLALGATGIAVAKVGEAEVMARNGIKDIFIANEIVGKKKLERIKYLNDIIEISFGLDSVAQLKMIEDVFLGSEKKQRF